jgi:recF protein
MRLTNLRLRAFRNYADLDYDPGAGLNILVGENAQGKSNLLEAVQLLATTKSLRASRDSEMVLQLDGKPAETAHVTAEVVREREGDVTLDLIIFPNDHKSVKVNGAKRPRVVDLLGQLNAVYFGSIDLAIVNADPSVRRRYLNMEIAQVSPKYVYDLASYKKSLEQRNRLLRDLRERPVRESGLEAWDAQLAHYGAPIIAKRRFFVERLAPLADEIHQELTYGKERLELSYLPSVPLPATEDSAAMEEAFLSAIEKVKSDELRRGTTLVGPQRDDMRFSINGMDARIFGSQGQQRTVTLSLKLAEYRLVEEYVGESPVMLLDDVMSDLDDSRRSHLLAWIEGRGQTFLTCTNLNAFGEKLLATAEVRYVSAGCLSEAPTSRIDTHASS